MVAIVISEKTQIIIYCVMNLISLYTLICGIDIFFTRKKFVRKQVIYLTYVIYLCVGVLTYFFNAKPYINGLISIVLVMVALGVFNGNLKNKLTFAFSWVMFRIVIEVFVSMIYIKILNIDLSTMINNDILKIVANAYIAILTLAIVKFTQLFIAKNENSEKITFIDSFQISIIPICSIFILYTFIDMSLKYNIDSLQIIFSILLIVFINLFSFYLFDKLRDTEKIKYENQLLKNQSEYYVKLEENINNSYDKIKTVKHDLKHQLLYLQSKTQENSEQSIDEIKTRLNYLIGDVLSDNINEYTKNQSLNRLINYKLFSVSDVSKNKIDFDIKINVCENSNFDESSMYIILGNAIDNAVENYNDEKSTLKKIVINIIEDNNNLFIKISNPYSKKLIFKNGMPITKKKDKEMHGIGLKSIKKLVDDKGGYFKIKTDDNIFSLEILLFDEIKF